MALVFLEIGLLRELQRDAVARRRFLKRMLRLKCLRNGEIYQGKKTHRSEDQSNRLERHTLVVPVEHVRVRRPFVSGVRKPNLDDDLQYRF